MLDDPAVPPPGPPLTAVADGLSLIRSLEASTARPRLACDFALPTPPPTSPIIALILVVGE
jgi:hypothetical protein